MFRGRPRPFCAPTRLLRGWREGKEKPRHEDGAKVVKVARGFRKVVKAHYKADIPLTDRSDWEDLLTQERAEIARLTAEIEAAEADINRRVYALFDLTDRFERITVSEQVGLILIFIDFSCWGIRLAVSIDAIEWRNQLTVLREDIDTGDEIFETVRNLFEQFSLDESVRLIGVGTGNLIREGEQPEQLALFSKTGQGDRLADALDEIHERYGDSSLRRGSELS